MKGIKIPKFDIVTENKKKNIYIYILPTNDIDHTLVVVVAQSVRGAGMGKQKFQAQDDTRLQK